MAASALIEYLLGLLLLSIAVSTYSKTLTICIYIPHPSTQTACIHKNLDGTPKIYGDRYGVFKYCFPKNVNTHYIRVIAEAVTEYNQWTNIRWYYDCASQDSWYYMSNNYFNGEPYATDYKIKALHNMGNLLGFCNEHQRPDRPNAVCKNTSVRMV